MCRYSGDGYYYRAEVITVGGDPTRAGVLYVDFGSCEFLPVDL